MAAYEVLAPERWWPFFAEPPRLLAVERYDRDDRVVRVRSSGVQTVARLQYPPLGLRGTLPTAERAAERFEYETMMRHWWTVAHARGGYC
jgi:hypothetical protein